MEESIIHHSLLLDLLGEGLTAGCPRTSGPAGLIAINTPWDHHKREKRISGSMGNQMQQIDQVLLLLLHVLRGFAASETPILSPSDS
jgi:hypothetical protein